MVGAGRDIPATFIAQLYGRAVPEDVVRYGADDLSVLAERAYDFIAERAPGAPKVRCETVPLAASADRKAVTVVEIVNDDMPFLVNSVMGEIADRRLDVRLVAHPLFGVQRKGSKLVALGAPDGAMPYARELYPYSSRADRRTRLRVTNWYARSKWCSAKSGWLYRIGAPCSIASTPS